MEEGPYEEKYSRHEDHCAQHYISLRYFDMYRMNNSRSDDKVSKCPHAVQTSRKPYACSTFSNLFLLQKVNEIFLCMQTWNDRRTAVWKRRACIGPTVHTTGEFCSKCSNKTFESCVLTQNYLPVPQQNLISFRRFSVRKRGAFRFEKYKWQIYARKREGSVARYTMRTTPTTRMECKNRCQKMNPQTFRSLLLLLAHFICFCFCVTPWGKIRM